MRFLFCLDLNLHAGAGKNFGIWNFVTEHGVDRAALPAINRRSTETAELLRV